MIDNLRLIDEIRAFVNSTDQTLSDHLVQMAEGYNKACRQANDRLARCNQFLQRGLLTEAIQVAETEPPLLEFVTLLELPERELWMQLLELYDLPRPPELLLANADALSAAYSQQDPLKQLLRTHRRLALARAPLNDRIQTMRQIAAIDTTNTIWVDDLLTFEKARHRQIKNEAVEAAQQHDLPRLEALYNELKSNQWQQPPAPELVDRVRIAVRSFRQGDARRLLAGAEDKLHKAYLERNTETGRAARDAWNSQLALAHLLPSDPLLERAEPRLDWLAHEDKVEAEEEFYQTRLLELEAALDDGDELEVIDKLVYDITRLDRELPPVLSRRVASYRRSREQTDIHKRRLILGAMAGTILLMVAGAFLLYRYTTRARTVEEAVATINAALEKGDLNAAGETHERLAQAGFASNPRLIEAELRIRDSRQAEDDRVAQFQAALQELSQTDPWEKQPDAARRAEELATHATEKRSLQRLIDERKQARDDLIAQQDALVGPRLDAMVQAMAGAESLIESNAPDAQIQAALGPIGAEMTAIESTLPRTSQETQRLHQLHSSRLRSLRQTLMKNMELASVELKLTQSILQLGDDGSAYVQALEAYCAASPQSLRGITFRRVLDARETWQAPIAWASFAPRYAHDPIPSGSSEAVVRAGQYSQFLDAHDQGPDTAAITRVKEATAAVARRDGADSLRDQLIDLLSDILVDRIYMVEVSESRDVIKRYYTKDQFGPSGPTGGRFDYLVGHDGREKTLTFIKPLVRSVALSPQSMIAAEFKRQLLEDESVANWDDLVLSLARRIDESEQLEPLLKWVLLKRVIELGIQGSVPLAAALERTAAVLDRSGVDPAAPWMDPDDSLVPAQRRRAEEFLAALPPWSEVASQLQLQQRQILQVFQQIRQPVGWLAQEGPGQWECRWPAAPGRDGQLWLVVPQGDGSTWRKLGTVAGGQARITPERSSDLVEGMLCFLDDLAGSAP